jgi:hypothetical protein
MLFCRAALPLSRKTLTFTAGIIRRHRRATGSAWRKLSPGQQALPVLVYLRKGETFAEPAAGSGVSTATAWRYVSKTVALLAARAPKLRTAVRDAKKAACAYAGPRIAAQVWDAPGDARTVLNVGAGAGSCEPPGRDVTAVEPSAVMRALRPEGAAPCVAAAAESLPFEDQSFDAAMAFSAVPRWQDPVAGLREMRRVARRVVVFTTYDASEFAWRRRFWLTRDYLPEAAGLADPDWLPRLADAIGAGPVGRAQPRPRQPRCGGAWPPPARSLTPAATAVLAANA